jgi:ribosomal protein L34E
MAGRGSRGGLQRQANGHIGASPSGLSPKCHLPGTLVALQKHPGMGRASTLEPQSPDTSPEGCPHARASLHCSAPDRPSGVAHGISYHRYRCNERRATRLPGDRVLARRDARIATVIARSPDPETDRPLQGIHGGAQVLAQRASVRGGTGSHRAQDAVGDRVVGRRCWR